MPDSRDIPADGQWPCQQDITPDGNERLVGFLYRLLRDGASAPGDVEQIAIDVTPIAQRRHDAVVDYTNPHLERYARSLAAHLLAGA
jgi:hypothetical protein